MLSVRTIQLFSIIIRFGFCGCISCAQICQSAGLARDKTQGCKSGPQGGSAKWVAGIAQDKIRIARSDRRRSGCLPSIKEAVANESSARQAQHNAAGVLEVVRITLQAHRDANTRSQNNLQNASDRLKRAEQVPLLQGNPEAALA